MRSDRARLLREIGRLEKRLRKQWAAEAPPVPAALESYRQEWLATLARPARHAGFAALRRAILGGRPLVVGDFHPASRSRRQFVRLLQELPELRRPAVILELLPAPVVMTAEAAARHPSLRLVDGRPCGQSYRMLLRELAGRGGMVAGAWTEGGPASRDAAAARRWQELERAHPEFSWLLFFGGWHLAEPHLPCALRARGAAPVLLHQAPEPLWNRRRPPWREEFLDLGGGHWAWLHTPPLTWWASALHDAHAADPEAGAEVTEHLIEALGLRLAEALHLREPAGGPAVWPAPEWSAFRTTLPAAERRALSSRRTPRMPILHPHLPAGWFDSAPDMNALLEAAGHVLACEWPLGREAGFGVRLRSRAFRRLWAVHLNPFLLPPDFRTAAALLYPGLGDLAFERELGKLGRALQAGRTPFLGARQRLLALEVLGARAGTRLAAQSRVDHSFVQEYLRTGGESLSWEDLAATIRAA